MAANISDTDVIIDTEGITVPECAHGMTFSNLFHGQIYNCYWIFSLKSGKELPTSATGISFNISLLLLKMYSYSYLPNRGLTRISYTISWICTIYMTVLTLNFLQRNAYAEILCVIIHAYNQCRPSTYVCAIQWIRCWQEILCMFCFSGQKRLQLLPVVWWESLTRETWNEKSD